MNTDVRMLDARLYFLPLKMRMPLKFGAETVDRITCARVCVTVRGRDGCPAVGWGETPLSAAWAWPGGLSYQHRDERMREFTARLATAWTVTESSGHPMEIGHEFIKQQLPGLLREENADQRDDMPWLTALICNSAFDIALHDAYGQYLKRPVYELYTEEYMNRDLSAYLTPDEDIGADFHGRYPCDYFVADPPSQLPAWHLVGGADALEETDLTGAEPDDGYPVTLAGWIERDQLTALKIKLKGNDSDWDYNRIHRVGELALRSGVRRLSTDFNCTVTDPAYVVDLLDRLKTERPKIDDILLYVEQPFPYELDAYPIDVSAVSSRKPLMMDESAHDWQHVRTGRRLGWNGVALKTCKTQTGALLSLCWAKAHGMSVMVQDLTNPALAMIPHLLLARHAGTIYGVETNAVQFWPDASVPESRVHPGLYDRAGGVVDLSSVTGPGFGYRVEKVRRDLPEPAVCPA